MEINIEASWLKVLEDEFSKDYFKNIKEKIISDIKDGIQIYPPLPLIFNAFELTHFDDLKVVIIGQDPYHGENQAHGLSFSVLEGIRNPPSLKNIYKEIERDLGIKMSNSGNLESWGKQGVLLLNAVLTVQAGNPASHSKIGWENFTDAVIKTISDKKEGIIFILWGNFAKSKKSLIDEKKHYILESAHPSPLGAYKGFFGSKPFSKTNEILKKNGKKEIDWKI
ncbi:MAG: uracil-DNA glycosylase [Candidatus Gracilibacteria bacterium]|nr:uracil-DNA glycosylase [Candidatus Gracilibacteria bacterium]